MFYGRKPRVISLALISFALVLSTVQNISVAHATALTCAEGGVCVVGDTGPGGGDVFYVAPLMSSFACGPTLSELCTHLENARSEDIAGVPTPWSVDSFKSTEVGSGAQGVSIGTGYRNTLNIIAQQHPYNVDDNNYLAGAAHAFSGGGKTDWYLPSTDELYQLHLSRLRTDPFAQSSTETSSSTSSGIYLPDPDAVMLTAVDKSDSNYVVAIRAFSRPIYVVNCPTAGTYTITGTVITSSSSCAGNLVIPEGVTSIGRSAFINSRNLTGVTIPSSVTSIGITAFQGDDRLTGVSLSEGLISIGQSAFYGASALTEITLPATLTSIGTWSFYRTSNLTHITFSGSGITVIPDYAFQSSGLTSIAIPTNVTTIGADAFANSKLTTVSIPQNVTSIQRGAFRNGIFTSVTFSSSGNLEEIGDASFYYNSHLLSVTLPDGLLRLGSNAFADTGLTELVIPASVTTLSDRAFSQSSNFSALTIPATVTSIGFEVFPGYPSSTPVQINLVKGTTYSYSFLACKELAPCYDDFPNTGYALTGTLPPGIRLNVVTGELSGTPTAAGTFNPTFTITYDPENSAEMGSATGTNSNFTFVVTGGDDEAAAEAARVAAAAAAAEAARVAAAAEAARVAALNAALAADAAKRALDQKQMSELLSVIPTIAGLALNIGTLTDSLLVKQKCVKGKTTKLVKKGAKCPKGYVKRK